MVVAAGFRRLTGLIRADDLYLVPDPIGGQIYSAAVATRFYPLFDHFFTVNLEFDFVAGNIGGEFFLISKILIAVMIFIIWHLGLPLSDIRIDCVISKPGLSRRGIAPLLRSDPQGGPGQAVSPRRNSR